MKEEKRARGYTKSVSQRADDSGGGDGGARVVGSLLDITHRSLLLLLTGPGYSAVSHTVRSIHRTERWTLTIVGRLYKVKLRPQNSPRAMSGSESSRDPGCRK
jgi:hypothetical protein